MGIFAQAPATGFSALTEKITGLFRAFRRLRIGLVVKYNQEGHMSNKTKIVYWRGLVYPCLKTVAPVTAGRTPTNRPGPVEIKILRAGLSYESPFNYLSNPYLLRVIPKKTQNFLSQ